MAPIRREERARYPEDWDEMTAWIRGRAGDRCECIGECGRDHAADPSAEQGVGELFHVERCGELNWTPAKTFAGRVVLTVAHLDHQPENSDPANLRAFCQGCHNRYDVPHRTANRRRRRREAAAIGDPFGARGPDR